MSGRGKVKALILSFSVLALIIILYGYKSGLFVSEADSEKKTAAGVVKDLASDVRDFFVNEWNGFRLTIGKMAEESAEERAKILAKEEAMRIAAEENLVYIDSHLEGDTNVIEVKSSDDPDRVEASNTLVTTETGERYLAIVSEGNEPGIAVYRYVKIPSEMSGIEFRPVEDRVFANENVKLYDDPMFENGSVLSASAGTEFTRVGISKDCCYQFIMEYGQVLYADGTKFRRYREDMETTETIDMEKERVILDVSYISQYPSLPNGCEITSLATVFKYLGFNVTKEKLSDDFLPKAKIGEANFYEEFVGNPRNKDAYGCYSGAIVTAANAYLESVGSDLRAKDYTGSTFKELLLKVREGNPVIVWATAYLNQNPGFSTEWIVDGEYMVWKGNLHCMVLAGYDTLKGTVVVSDPMRGIEEYDMELFIKRFKQFYSQAVIVE